MVNESTLVVHITLNICCKIIFGEISISLYIFFCIVKLSLVNLVSTLIFIASTFNWEMIFYEQMAWNIFLSSVLAIIFI